MAGESWIAGVKVCNPDRFHHGGHVCGSIALLVRLVLQTPQSPLGTPELPGGAWQMFITSAPRSKSGLKRSWSLLRYCHVMVTHAPSGTVQAEGVGVVQSD